MKNIGILLVGCLNFKDNELYLLKEKIKGYDLFISTYKKYKKYVVELNPINYSFIDDNVYINSKNQKYNIIEYINTYRNKGGGHIFQWYHLENIIKNNIITLSKYNILIKIRTDYVLKDELSKLNNINDNVIYAQTDQLYYGNSLHFINIFKDIFYKIDTLYWSDIQKRRYYNINYDYFLKSDLNQQMIKWNWIDLPSFLYKGIDINSSLSNIYLKLCNNIRENIKILNNNSFNKDDLSSTKGWWCKFDSEQYFITDLLCNTIVKPSILRYIRTKINIT